MSEPNDRPLEDYLKGGSKLSQKYREASGETAPPDLDDKILAEARKAVSPRRRRVVRPWFSGLALAASLVLAVNLGWNVYRAKPPLEEAPSAKDIFADRKGFVPNPPPAAAPAQPQPEAVAPQENVELPPAAKAEHKSRANDALAQRNVLAAQEADADEARKKEAGQAYELQKQQREAGMARRDEPLREAAPPGAAAGAMSSAAAPEAMPASPAESPAPAQSKMKADALTEPQKIDRLIDYVGNLQDAKFVRNGTEYGPADAANHLRLKRRNAGDRVKTADDFIKYCASFSSTTGEAYLIRFADGRTRTSEDVLREELARINAGG